MTQNDVILTTGSIEVNISQNACPKGVSAAQVGMPLFPPTPFTYSGMASQQLQLAAQALFASFRNVYSVPENRVSVPRCHTVP